MKRQYHTTIAILLIVLSVLLIPLSAQRGGGGRGGGGSTDPCTQGTPFRGCRACGTAKSLSIRRLSVLKNRDGVATNPQPKTVAEIRDPANASGFSPSQHVEVTGFVASVEPGGDMEACNCKRADLRDVHINIVADASEATDQSKYVIVEFTPRWEKQLGFDDSNYEAMRAAVESQLRGKMVRFQGYMMDDFEHRDAAKNTASPGTPTCTGSASDPKPCVWRATTWEVHPVTAYTVVK